MNSRPSLFKDMTNYLVGRGSLILLGFITFPLLTRLLSVSEYGVLSLTLRITLLLVVLSKCGLQYSAARFFKGGTAGEPEQKRFYSTLLICPSCIAILVSLLYYLLIVYTPIFHGDVLLYRCLLVAPVVVFLRTLQSILLSFLRNEGKSRFHTIIEVATKSATIVAYAYLAIAGLHQAFAVLLGVLVSECAVIALQLFGFLRRGLISLSAVDWTLIRESLTFGAPLIVYELSSLALDSGDRLIVQRFLGDHQLGLYSAAYGVSGYLQDTVMTPLNLAIFPIYMRLWNEEGREATQRFLSKTLSWFIVAALFLSGAAALCSREALIVLASMRFAGAERLLSILIPALMVYALHIFFNVGLILEKRTAMLAVIAVASAAINIVANLYWVPRFQLTGAAFATLLSYAVMVAALVVVNHRILPLTPRFSLVLSAVVATLLAYPLPSLLHTALPITSLLVRSAGYTTIFFLGMAAISSDFRAAVHLASRRIGKTRPVHSAVPGIASLDEYESTVSKGVSQ